MLLDAVVYGTILHLARQANTSPNVLNELFGLLFVVDTLRDLLQLFAAAAFLEEVKVNSFELALNMLSLLFD